MEYETVADQTYKEVPLDIARLENEVRRSMADDNIDPHSFYWFLATEEGKKEDLLLRGKSTDISKENPV